MAAFFARVKAFFTSGTTKLKADVAALETRIQTLEASIKTKVKKL